MLLRARRPFTLGGRDLQTGDIIDLSEITLPPGRAQRLVDARLGEYVVGASNSCDACDRAFATAHALAIHKSRAHRDTTEE